MNQMCRICVQSFSKLISLESYGLRTAYKQVTGVSVEYDDGLPRELCVECATLLDKYHRFRDKAIRGELLLRQIYNDFGYITKSLIESRNVKLLPLLTIHHCIIDKTFQNDTDRYESIGKEEMIHKNDELKELITEDYSNCDIIKNDTIGIIHHCIIDKTLQNDEDNDRHESIRKEKIIQKNDELKDLITENDGNYDIIKNDTIDDDTIDIKIENDDDSNDLCDEESIFVIDKPAAAVDTVKVIKSEVKNKKKKKTKPKDKINSLNRSRKINNELLLQEYFKVTKLSFEDQIKKIEERKFSSNYLNNKFKCEFCFQGFQCQRTYNTHMQKHSQARGSHSCEVCRATFPKTEQVTKHHRETHLHMYECVKCHITIANRTAAVFHATWHKGKKYACQQCDAVFDKKSTYLGHVRIKHPSEHACQYCGYSFLGEKGLYAHRNKKHYMETQKELSGPWCRECNVQFYSEDALTVHNGIKHSHLNWSTRNQSKSTVVERHENTTGMSRKETREQREKTKVKYPVPCEACGVELKTGWEYRFHFMRSHPDRSRTFYPYLDTHRCICDKCGKVFGSKSFLSNHLLTHEESWPYACATCPKRFKTPLQLKIHLKIHMAPSYPCSVCGLMYNQKGNRDRHVRLVHSDEKKFKCDYCEKCFKSNEEKKLHTRHIHWKKPWPKRNRKCTDKKSAAHSDPP